MASNRARNAVASAKSNVGTSADREQMHVDEVQQAARNAVLRGVNARDATGCRDALTQCRRTKKSHGQQDQNGERQEQRQERTVRDHENTQPPLPP